MTYGAFLATIREDNRPTAQRRGQFYFSALYLFRPEVADEIRTSRNDPYYNDDRIPGFLEAVAALWDAPQQP